MLQKDATLLPYPAMATIREIKGRMKAVSNIKRITKTMQMIAAARFQAALKRATATKPYSQKIAELVGELSSAGDTLEHPLLKSPEEPVNKTLILVLSSNRGLCGGYNANIMRVLSKQLKAEEEAGNAVQLEVVGKKGLGYCKFNNIPVDRSYLEFGDEPKFEDVLRLANQYMDAFKNGEYDSIRIISMAFHTASRQTPEAVDLLPLKPPATEQAEGEEATGPKGPGAQDIEYDFSPDPEELLGELLPETVKIRLFQCFNEAVVSEQVARMVAMKAATDAAGKMGKSLTRQFNRARQTAITTELSEIIGGSAALE